MSDDENSPRYRGPIEESPWPTQIVGHVVDARAPMTIRGYDVVGDLARHYSFASVIHLSLTGEIASDDVLCAFETALVCAAPVGVAEAPAHAAGLARLVGSSSSSVLQVGAVGLAERAAFVVRSQAAFLAWLSEPRGEIPANTRAVDADDATHGALLRDTMAARCRLPIAGLVSGIGMAPALLACFHACGLKRVDQLESALVIAGLACVSAEAASWSTGRFREYPMNTPVMKYERVKR